MKRSWIWVTRDDDKAKAVALWFGRRPARYGGLTWEPVKELGGYRELTGHQVALFGLRWIEPGEIHKVRFTGMRVW